LRYFKASRDHPTPIFFHTAMPRRDAVEMVIGAVVELPAMTSDGSPSSDNEPRVVSFPRGRAGARAPVTARPAVADLRKFEQGADSDDYRDRMIVNAAAFLFVIALIGAGLWLADTMAQVRKNQDCVLSGRRGCTPVEVTKDRW
jgi:hypothetical protein